jgi:hypothetical protein
LPNRTYFFNIKENRNGDLFLNIVESKGRDDGGFDRQSVIVFEEDLNEFMRGFDASLKMLEKEIRERRKSGSRFGRRADDEGGGREDARGREEYSGRERSGQLREERPRRDYGRLEWNY